jgi:hypothetical protein
LWLLVAGAAVVATLAAGAVLEGLGPQQERRDKIPQQNQCFLCRPVSHTLLLWVVVEQVKLLVKIHLLVP